MRLLPMRTPRFGLAFSSCAVTLVERAARRRGLGRPRIRRLGESRLPSGLILPGDNTSNIMDLDALTAEVRDLLAPLRGQPVALSLPDQAAQMALFEFESLPRDSSEREALLRWRFREDLSLPHADAHLAYRVFGDRRRARILAVRVQRGVLSQYEQLCEGLGLLPLSIGISSLDLFDLCRALTPRRGEIYFAHCSADGWTFLAVRAGIPALLRMKNTRGAGVNIATELLGTLQYYEDLVDGKWLPAERSDRCLWLVDSRREVPEDDPLSAGELRLGFQSIPVHHLGWEKLAAPKKRVRGFSVSGLPALAGMVAAPRPHVNFGARGYAVGRLLQTAMILILLGAIGYGSYCWMESARLNEASARQTQSALRAQAMNQGFAAKLAQDGLMRSQAEIEDVYQRVDFANQLAQKRSFSWTRLLHYLETAIPARASIQSVRLDFKESAVSLKGRVRTLGDLEGLVDSLERHDSFHRVQIMTHAFREIEEGRESRRPKQGVRSATRTSKPRKHRVVEFELSVGYATEHSDSRSL